MVQTRRFDTSNDRTRSVARALCCLAALAAAQHVSADVLDGSRAGDPYGPAIAVQQVQTQFGDNLSELNAAYGVATEGAFLKVVLTGQVENNFNRLNIFIDSVVGGQSTIGPDTNNGGLNPPTDFLAENYSGKGASASENGPGFTFDSGFEADYAIIARNGNFGGNRFDLSFLSIGNDSVNETSNDIFGGSLTGVNASVGASGIGVGYDNSNVAGVTGGTSAANTAAALAVETGLELWIPMAAIGNPSRGNTILISAHINASNHDFLSNQFLGALVAPQGNLGGDGAGNFNNDVSLIDLGSFGGNQFFALTVVPHCDSVVVANAAFDVNRTFQACGDLTVGPNVSLTSPGVFGFFAGQRISFVGDFDTDTNLSAGTCGQDLCTTGPALESSCMPCVGDICSVDPPCCSNSWSDACVAAVESVCLLDCP